MYSRLVLSGRAQRFLDVGTIIPADFRLSGVLVPPCGGLGTDGAHHMLPLTLQVVEVNCVY